MRDGRICIIIDGILFVGYGNVTFNTAAFLCFFFPAVFFLSRVFRGKKSSTVFLGVVSLVFYAFGGVASVPVLLFAFLWNYVFGRLLGKGTAGRKGLFVLGILGDLLLLGVFKYLGFLLSGINGLFSLSVSLPEFVLPLGISFYTFHGISYLTDVYRDRELEEKDASSLFLYLAFFPRLLAGPIVKYKDARSALQERSIDPENTAAGLRRFLVGMSKKLLLSESCAAVVNGLWPLSAEGLGTGFAWLAAIGYCLQLYFDFSGYSDMAIGLGRMFGFSLPENFNYPYAARSLSDFWRRWHMTLNRWFVDYLYIPLGGSRRSKGRNVLNKMIVFLCTGIWHGAGWTFLLWGLWHGAFVSLESSCKGFFSRVERRLPGRVLLRVYTLLVVILGFVMFRSASVREGFAVIGQMFSLRRAAGPVLVSAQALLTPARLGLMGLSAVLSLPVIPAIRAKLFTEGSRVQVWIESALCLMLLLLCIGAMAGGSFSPFIYQQF